MSRPGKWEAWDFYAVCRALMHGDSHYRPWEILRLTEPEMLAALDADLTKRRPPTESTPLGSDEEVRAFLERRRALTPEERLREAMEED